VDDKDAQHIYVTYAINTEFDSKTSLGNDNVVVQDSTDGGKTWKPERRVTVSGNTKGRRFMPWVCAVDGTAHVSWYDRRVATAANNDLTDYFTGSASLNKEGNLVAGTDVQVNQAGTADAQCAIGWPGSVFEPNDSESCSVQPQLAGSCSVSGSRCDFSDAMSGGTFGCPTRETCNATGGQPKYGDYNGNACAAGRLYLAWASATPPGSGGIDIFFESFLTAPTFTCFGVPATIIGTTGKDTLVGTPGDDVIVGLGGNDAIDGKGGDDLLCGDEGDDTIRGGLGNDRIDGGLGNDSINGGPGNDTIFGGAGRDTIAGAGGDDHIDGGPDRDSINGGPGTDVCVNGEIVAGCP
jgi:Ca2+-binding RTX toxin-like protein